MTMQRPSAVLKKLENPAYTPAERDLPELWQALVSAEEEQEKLIVKALLRRKAEALDVGLRQDLAADVRGSMTAALGRLAAEAAKVKALSPEKLQVCGDALLAVLALTPEVTRAVRAAIRALGNLEEFDSAEPLLAFWKGDTGTKHRQALVIALGKVGGVEALELLEASAAELNAQVSLQAALQNSLLLLRRRLQRHEHSAIAATAQLTGPTAPKSQTVEVRFHCRAGLERLLVDECPPAWDAVAGKQCEVLARVNGPVGNLFRVRTAESFGFPIRVTGASNSIEAVELALTAPATQELIKNLTTGKATYRIEWADDGARRSVTRDVATRLAQKLPELVNETRQPLWQIVVRRRVREIDIELVPRGLADPRFAWRQDTVAASSHAPLAAALVRLARPKPSDVVWDPFVGAGTELIECGLNVKVARLIGSDTSGAALQAARDNFVRAGLLGQDGAAPSQKLAPLIELIEGSCLDHPPSGVSCIITNPPLGRRVERGGAAELLTRFVPVAFAALGAGGRLVWVTPDAETTNKAAQRAGFELSFRVDVDMGGFHSQIQVLKKPTAS